MTTSPCTQNEVKIPATRPPATDDDSTSAMSIDNLEDVVHQENPEDVKVMCTICNNCEVNILVRPCNHVKMCETCSLAVLAQAIADNVDAVCPFCRGPIQETLKVYM